MIAPQGHRKRIWIDLDNSPHVPFFAPIVAEFEKQGHQVFLTTRDTYQVRGLADYYGMKHTTVGRHYGANKVLKVLGTVWRSVQLARTVLRWRPDISLSHGSRSLILLSSLLGIPTILLFDYEHARRLPFIRPALGMVPESIDPRAFPNQFKFGVRTYPGLKEDIYAASFTPDPGILRQLDLKETDLLVTIRPPATEAHYHNPESEKLFLEVVDYLASFDDVRMVILPRNEKAQREFVLRQWPELIRQRKIQMPEKVVDGLNLIWHSDLVVSGGGTMNREAAALGVPVYSIFRGSIGAVDRYLAAANRLTLIEKPEEVRTRIVVRRRQKQAAVRAGDASGLGAIVRATNELLGTEVPLEAQRMSPAGSRHS